MRKVLNVDAVRTPVFGKFANFSARYSQMGQTLRTAGRRLKNLRNSCCALGHYLREIREFCNECMLFLHKLSIHASTEGIRHARSRKGPWHMAKTIASGVGLTNAWLGEQGLLSLKTLWASLAQLR